MSVPHPATEVTSVPVPSNTIEFAGILGGMSANIANLTTAIEKQGTMMEKFDERLRKVEGAVETIQATQYVAAPKAPWYSIVGGVVGIVTGAGSLIALLAVMSRIQ